MDRESLTQVFCVKKPIRKNVKDGVRNYLDGLMKQYGKNVVFTDDNLKSLVEYYTSAGKVSDGIVGFSLNGGEIPCGCSNKSFDLIVHYDDLTSDSISWNKCVDGLLKSKTVYDIHKRRMEAMYRNTSGFSKWEAENHETKTKCTHCGSNEYLQVDHIAPSFKEIQTSFLEKHPEIEIMKNVSLKRWVFKDKTIKNEWETHHDNLATYQWLCRSCNASKGTRKEPKRRKLGNT